MDTGDPDCWTPAFAGVTTGAWERWLGVLCVLAVKNYGERISARSLVVKRLVSL